MAKKGMKVDEFIDLLKEDRVQDVLMERLSVSLVPIIEGIFNRLVDAFSKKLDLQVEQASRELIASHCEIQSRKLASLEGENESLRTRLDQAEVDLRRNNLVIHGLAESEGPPQLSAQ